MGRCRSRFLSDFFFFSESLASFAARGFRVGFLFFGTMSAFAIVSASRSSAAVRFRSWLRVSLATIRIDPSSLRRDDSRVRSLSRCSSVSALDSLTFHESSTREDVLFTCCPPAPDERDARIVTSDRGITSDSLTGIPSVSCWESGATDIRER